MSVSDGGVGGDCCGNGRAGFAAEDLPDAYASARAWWFECCAPYGSGGKGGASPARTSRSGTSEATELAEVEYARALVGIRDREWDLERCRGRWCCSSDCELGVVGRDLGDAGRVGCRECEFTGDGVW